MSSLGLVLLAGAILLPEYDALRRLDYDNQVTETRLREAHATVEAMDRFLNEVPGDPVLTARLAWSQLGKYPTNEVVVMDPSLPPAPRPGSLSEIHLADPPPPTGWWQRQMRRVSTPAKRRGLLILGGAMVVASALMFAPPNRRRRSA